MRSRPVLPRRRRSLRPAATLFLITAAAGVALLLARPPRQPLASPSAPPGAPASIVPSSVPSASADARPSPASAVPGPTPPAASPTLSSRPPSPFPASPSISPPAPPSATAPGGPIAPFPPTLGFERVVRGLDLPVFVTAPAGDERLFVIEQRGRIRIVRDGALQRAPFLDIRDLVRCCAEQGLLGLAFHPRYAENGRFFVYYSDRRGDIELDEVRRATADRADRATRRRVLHIAHPVERDHYAGMLQFGADGYLYVATGDGGGVDDPGRNAQDTDDLLGKILRLDVDAAPGPGLGYAIPRDNPFTGAAGRDEVWAYGLRNPWRWSFDRATSAMWIGDVGQDRYEEVSRHADGRGVDFGWDVLEGRHCNRPRRACDRMHGELPIVEFAQQEGISQVSLGGYVYRGADQPALQGWYVFAEAYTGEVWAIRSDTGPLDELPTPAMSGLFITSFGEDGRGELYLTSYRDGAVYRVTGR